MKNPDPVKLSKTRAYITANKPPIIISQLARHLGCSRRQAARYHDHVVTDQFHDERKRDVYEYLCKPPDEHVDSNVVDVIRSNIKDARKEIYGPPPFHLDKNAYDESFDFSKHLFNYIDSKNVTKEKSPSRPLPLKDSKNAREATPITPVCAKKVYQGTGRVNKLVVGLPDMHLPCGSGLYAKSAQAALKFCHDMKPDEIVIMGDFLDLASIAHWNKDKPGRIVEKSLGKDFAAGNMALDTLQQFTNKVTYLEGNHEAWLTQLTERDIGLRGAVELQSALRLYDRRIDLIPENGVYKIGEARLIHGWYTGVYHARQTVDAAMTNVFYGHTHDVQSFSKTKRPGHDPIIAQSCGCLCDHNPEFLRNKPNRWASGCLILQARDNGTFTHYVPVIVNGFIYNGKEYSA